MMNKNSQEYFDKQPFINALSVLKKQGSQKKPEQDVNISPQSSEIRVESDIDKNEDQESEESVYF